MSGISTDAIRVLIADDETAARRRLQYFLAAEPDFRVAGESQDGRDACTKIAQLAPDLVFLDVEMPELSGIEVVERIGPDRMPATIFATAYDHYAMAAFDANAIDYLLKPFDDRRFARSIAKVRHQVRGEPEVRQREKLLALIEGFGNGKTYPDRLLVKLDDAQQLVKMADIVHISADRNYINIHTTEGVTHVMRETMKGIQGRLDPAMFRRIHRSHIVNLDHVRRILPWFGGDRLVMTDNGARFTLSRNYLDALEGFR